MKGTKRPHCCVRPPSPTPRLDCIRVGLAMDWGSIRARLSQAASGLDQRIAAEAAARAEGNRGAGIERNRQFVMGQQPATAAARISAEAHGGFAGGSLEKLLSGNRGRIGEIANHYAPQMRRGPMATQPDGGDGGDQLRHCQQPHRPPRRVANCCCRWRVDGWGRGDRRGPTVVGLDGLHALSARQAKSARPRAR
jgi:hypothetical protein